MQCSIKGCSEKDKKGGKCQRHYDRDYARMRRQRLGLKPAVGDMLGIVPKAFGHWLAGLIDGEGCFLFHVDNRYGGCRPRFQLKLRDDDAEIIHDIARITNIGVIVRAKARKTSRPVIVWVVAHREESQELVRLLRKFPLRSKKARDFEIWARAVAIWPERQASRDSPNVWVPLQSLRKELQRARTYR